MFGLTILGNNSAVPAFDRHPTSQALTYDNQVYLIDCGEGTQLQLSRYKVRRSKINHIFISHLHGDHYFGLIGLITSMGLMGREQPLYIYGPPILSEIISLQLNAASTQLKYHLHFIPLQEEGIILDSPKMEVFSFPVKHRVPCWGFIFREKRLPFKLIVDKAQKLGIPFDFFHKLQLGEDYRMADGRTIINELVTVPNTPGRIYAYSADTIFDETLIRHFQGANLLYHESTYLHEMESKAVERFHTTAVQAGVMAQKAGAIKLLIGHFSSKYDDLNPFLEEARQNFPETELASEGVTYRILQKHNSTINGKPSLSQEAVHLTVPTEASAHFQ